MTRRWYGYELSGELRYGLRHDAAGLPVAVVAYSYCLYADRTSADGGIERRGPVREVCPVTPDLLAEIRQAEADGRDETDAEMRVAGVLRLADRRR